MSCLKNEQVVIKLIPENHDPKLNEGQDGYIKLENTHFTVGAPLTMHGIYEVLNDKERVELEAKIDSTRKTGWLSASKVDGNAWTGKSGYKLVLGVDPVVLDLSKPLDYIKYKLAVSNSDTIAPSFKQRLDRLDYTYYMEYKSVEEEAKLSSADKKMKAYSLATPIADNRTKVLDALLVLYAGDYRRVQQGISLDQAKIKLFDIVENSTDGFIEIMDDKEKFASDLTFYLAVASGAIVRNAHSYSLGYSNQEDIGVTELDAMSWLNKLKEDADKGERQDVFLALKQRIKSYKDRR